MFFLTFPSLLSPAKRFLVFFLIFSDDLNGVWDGFFVLFGNFGPWFDDEDKNWGSEAFEDEGGKFDEEFSAEEIGIELEELDDDRESCELGED